MCSNCLSGENFIVLEKFINDLPSKEGALIEVLHKAQGLFGYLPQEVQAFVAAKLSIPVSKVYGVVTFYSYFTINFELGILNFSATKACVEASSRINLVLCEALR